MATIQHKSHDRTVAHIAERNNIHPRRPGMTVLVLDAIGDHYAGSGRAVYRWDEVQASWILMFKDNVETLTFTGESKSISQDKIQLSQVPANGQIWDVTVRDGLVVHQVEHSVAGSVVTIQPDTPGQFDGKQLSVRYAYGTMTQQLDLEIARVVGEAVGGKSDSGHAHGAATASAAGFMSATDKSKLDGVAEGANNYSHPTGDGNLHVPATGTTNAGKVLTAGATPGSASWQDPTTLGSAAGSAPGTASAGTSSTAARSDHVHPLQSSVTGSAGTASKLANPRTINGVSFDGSANITINAVDSTARVAATGGTASGLTLNGGYIEEQFAVSGGSPALSPSNGSIQSWSLSVNSSPTLGSFGDGQSMTLLVDDGSAKTINWPASLQWKTNGGMAPALVPSGYTTIVLFKVGGVVYGARVGDA